MGRETSRESLRGGYNSRGMSSGTLVDGTLARIIARLAEAVEPEKLILFGSRAAGTAGRSHDYDLLIIGEAREPLHRRLRRARQALWGVGAPVDLLWYTREEVDAWADIPTHVVSQAIRRGRVVYEKGQG